MITATDQAVRGIHALAAEAGRAPCVRVRALGSGRPMPVRVAPETEHRPDDWVIASSDGVLVLVDRELAAAVDGHTLDLWEGDGADGPRFVFTTARN